MASQNFKVKNGLDIGSNISTNDTVSIIPNSSTGTSYNSTITPAELTASRTYTLPDVTGTFVTTGDTGSVTNTMLAGSIANNKLSNSTISGVSLGSDLNTLTIGTGLSGTSYNGSGAVTIAIDSTVATLSGTQTLSGKTIAAGSNTITGLTNSNLSGSAAISNANLQNSSITVGTTAISLGSSSTTLTGLTSVTATTFTGALSGGSVSATTGSFSSDVTIAGNLTINGTTTTVNSTTITVDDINLELGSVATPTDTTANGGGITLKGATDKTIIWDSTNANWTSSENLNIPTGKTYKINNVNVLSSTGLGSSVVSSSLTSVGTITSGTWSGSFGAVSGANLTSLTAGNLTGTIPSGVLGNSTVYVGTTAVALNRTSGSLALTGITSIDGNAATATTATTANALNTSNTYTGVSFNSITGLSSTTPVMDGTAAVGTSTTVARADHVHGSDTSKASLSGATFTGTVTHSSGSTLNGGITADTSIVNIGSGQIYKDTSGNVGIGTSSPSVRLDIKGTAVAQDLINLSNSSGATTGQIGINGNSGNESLYLWTQGGTNSLRFGTNGSERMRIDSAGNVGIGVAPSGWGNSKALELNNSVSIFSRTDGPKYLGLTCNNYYNGTSSIYKTSDFASFYEQYAGGHKWYTAPSGTAGNTITWTNPMTLNASGRLLLGTTTDDGVNTLQVNGSVGVGGSGITLKSALTDSNGLKLSMDSAGVGYINAGYSSSLLKLQTNNTDRMTIDSSGNVGIGVVPSAWDSSQTPALQIKTASLSSRGINDTIVGSNLYRSTSAYAYINNGYSTMYNQYNGTHTWYTAPSGTAGNAITFTNAMSLDTSGNLAVTGTLTAASKSFLIDHPTKPDMKLQYGSLEGPENGVYVRGITTSNIIELPDYWTGLIDEDTITVQLTPNKGFQKLYVNDIKDNKVFIAEEDEKQINAFYTVYGERKDIEKLVVEF